jgi:lysozyme
MTGEELNTRATLSTIRETEGHGTPLEYDAQYGNGTLENLDDHPRENVTKWGYTSSAAGAYQFLTKTWDAHATELGLTDFSPVSQDKAALREIGSVKGATGLISEGKYPDVLKKLSGKWTSLPGGVHKWKGSNASEIFIKYRASELSSNSIIATPQGSLLK